MTISLPVDTYLTLSSQQPPHSALDPEEADITETSSNGGRGLSMELRILDPGNVVVTGLMLSLS